MIVDVDIGNTFTKWRVLGQSTVDRQKTSSIASGWLFDAQIVKRVRIACVAEAGIADALVEQVKSRWGVEAERAVVTDKVAGIRLVYEDISRLGVDRWLGMLTAYQKNGSACAIVSAGSAITADWIGDNGDHRGGFIVPGRQRLEQSLLSGVANVLREPLAPDDSTSALGLGVSTESCVSAGINNMLAGFLSRITEVDKVAPLFVTGGDSSLVLKLLGEAGRARTITLMTPVLDGLAVALP